MSQCSSLSQGHTAPFLGFVLLPTGNWIALPTVASQVLNPSCLSPSHHVEIQLGFCLLGLLSSR